MNKGCIGNRYCYFYCLLLALSTPAFGEGLFSFKVENDALSAGGDGHYTNGIEGIWAFEPADGHWARNFADALPGWSASRLDGVAYRFAQHMYTPNEIDVEELIQDDRPYAGLLYGGVSLFQNVQHNDWRQADSLHLDVGTVGPASGAQEVQRSYHDLIATEEPKGWDNQLDNEPIVNLGYKRAWVFQQRLAGLEIEYGPSAGFALGNLYTFASSGLGLRLGEGLDRSFGIPAVAPAHSGQSSFQRGQGFTWYAFANIEGRYMARNLLLDGNTFENSHSVDRREWVDDAQLGAALTWDSWQVAYTYLWRSDEFEEQGRFDQFGSLTFSAWL